jgi:hypothetical protein
MDVLVETRMGKRGGRILFRTTECWMKKRQVTDYTLSSKSTRGHKESVDPIDVQLELGFHKENVDRKIEKRKQLES